MRKTYTIYIVRHNSNQLRSFCGLSCMQKSFAEGAMAMAESFYNKYHLVCKCDQTDEILSEVKPREIHLNTG